VIRVLWPKTSFREGIKGDKSKSPEMRRFYFVVGWMTKIFYIWAKHFIGYFLNYVRFLDKINEEERAAVYFTLIFASFATTISMFLHTLRFKHYIGPYTSYLTYMASYLGTFYGFYLLSGIFVKNVDLTILVLGGIVVNFMSWKIQTIYQILVMIFFYMDRYNLFPVVSKMFNTESDSVQARLLLDRMIL